MISILTDETGVCKEPFGEQKLTTDRAYQVIYDPFIRKINGFPAIFMLAKVFQLFMGVS